MSTYEPGTVAVATVHGVPNVRVIRRATGWASAVVIDADTRVFHPDRIAAVTDIRPLVVLDLGVAAGIAPESRAVEYAVRALRGAAGKADSGHVLDAIADQIEQQTRPPKPPEPTGLGAVVEAIYDNRFVRVDDSETPWQHVGNGSQCEYEAIAVVRVLSEGWVQS